MTYKGLFMYDEKLQTVNLLKELIINTISENILNTERNTIVSLVLKAHEQDSLSLIDVHNAINELINEKKIKEENYCLEVYPIVDTTVKVNGKTKQINFEVSIELEREVFNKLRDFEKELTVKLGKVPSHSEAIMKLLLNN